MELVAPVRDIYELVAAFAEKDSTELYEMKELWRSRNFSFIHEARPKDASVAFFVQSLFSASLCHIMEGSSLSWQLGGLYVLYILHETQPEPPFRIYLSLEQLECFHGLSKSLRVISARAVLRRMFNGNMFLYGSVSGSQIGIAANLQKLAELRVRRLSRARSRLLSNTPIQEHISGDMVKELLADLDGVLDSYAVAKQLALSDEAEESSNPAHAGFQIGSGTSLEDELKNEINTLEKNRLSSLSMDSSGGDLPC